MGTLSRPLRYSIAASAVLVSSLVAGAQTYRGGIAGTVQDASGAAVAHAKVTLTNPDNGYTREMESTSSGDYTFQDLQPSNAYVISVTSSGFGTIKIDKISVRPGQIFGLDPKLAVNSAAESVEVNAAAIALDTVSSTNNNVVNEKAVANIPLNGRDFTQLVKITPGVNGAGSVNGTRTNQNNYQIDGADSNDIWQNATAANQGGVGPVAGVTLPVEAIDQFTVQSSGNAEAGRNPGGLISLGLKTGTNKFHGSAYYYGRSEFFAARDWFQADGTRKTKVRNAQYGASIGGPILTDKLFFFLNWEHQKYVIQIPGTQATEPGAAYIAKATALLQRHGGTVNPLSQSLLRALYQGGYNPNIPASLNNYIETTPRVGYSDNVVGNLNYILTPKQTVRMQAFVGTGRQVEPGGATSFYFQAAPDITQNFSIAHNWAITDRFSNQLLVGLGIFNQTFNDNNHSFNIPSLGLNTGVTNSSLYGAPTITLTGFDTVGSTQPLGRKDYTGHITDAATWVHGKHQFRFGGEFRRNYMDLQYQNGVRGTFSILGTASAAYKAANPGAAISPWSTNTATPTALASDADIVGTQTEILSLTDFLGGYYNTATLLAGNLRRDMFRTDLGFFMQDSYHITPKLTLNYGVRHEFTGALSSNGILSAFRPGSAGSDVYGLTRVGGEGFAPSYRPGKLHFSPRVGFNYNPIDKMIVRASYGLYFDAPPFNGFLDSAPGTTGTNARGLQANPIVVAAQDQVQNQALSVGQWQTNVALFPSANTSVKPATNTTVGLFSIDPNLRMAYAHNFNLATELQLSRNTVFTLGYAGSLGVHLYTMLDVNQPGLGTGVTTAALLARRPVNLARSVTYYDAIGAINQVSSPGQSNYNSLQTSLKTAGYHGLTGQFSYTLGHSLDNTSGFRSTGPINSYNLRQDYGNASFDVRHTVNAYVVYEAPQFAHALPVLTKGWQANSFVTAFTGTPLNITVGDNTGTGQAKDRASWKNGDTSANYKNADRSIQVITNRKAIQYYTAGPVRAQGVASNVPFEIPIGNSTGGTATAASYGNMRRNQLRGPGFFTVDASVVKNTQLREGVNLQVRAEMFNLFNRINPGSPTTTPTSAAFGQITAGRNSGFGAGTPFNVQFAGKLIF